MAAVPQFLDGQDDREHAGNDADADADELEEGESIGEEAQHSGTARYTSGSDYCVNPSGPELPLLHLAEDSVAASTTHCRTSLT